MSASLHHATVSLMKLATLTSLARAPQLPSSLSAPIVLLRATTHALRHTPGAAMSLARANPSAAVLFLGVTAFFILALTLFLYSLPAEDAIARTAPATRVEASASPYARPLEMHIANNGLTLLRSARVVAVDGTTITAHTTWGSVAFVWTVRTNATQYETREWGTRFLTVDGNKNSLANIQPGDLVTITGTLDSTADVPTIDADSVRTLR